MAFFAASFLAASASAIVPGRNGELLIERNNYLSSNELVKVSPDGSDPRVINTPEDTNLSNAQFAPDAQSVIFGSSWSNSGLAPRAIFSHDLNSSTTKQVWDLNSYGDRPVTGPLSYSPDGKSIMRTHFYVGWKDGISYEVVRDPNNGIRILRGGTTFDVELDQPFEPTYAIFSPDGKRIAFLTGNDFTEPHGIHVTTPAGGDSRLVYTAQERVASLSFSPDGRRLAFASYLEPDIWTIGVDGKGLRRLTSDRSSTDPMFSPDGRKIAYSGQGSIWVMKTDGSDKRLVVAGESLGSARLLDWGRAEPFRIVRYNREKSMLVVRTWGPGRVSVRGPQITRRSRAIKASGIVRVPVAARANVRLKAGAKVKTLVKFAPRGALPSTEKTFVRLGR